MANFLCWNFGGWKKFFFSRTCRIWVDIYNQRGRRPCPRRITVKYAQARIFRYLAKEHNFWNLSTFLEKKKNIKEHEKSLKESFSGNSVKILDCWALSHINTISTGMISEISCERFSIFIFGRKHFCCLAYSINNLENWELRRFHC